MIKAIMCTGFRGEIGYNGDMPWGLSMKGDLAFFKYLTIDSTIIMGRKTFDIVGILPNRETIVISKKGFISYPSKKEIKGESLISFLNYYKGKNNPDIIICGGSTIYSETLHLFEELYITIINKEFDYHEIFPLVKLNTSYNLDIIGKLNKPYMATIYRGIKKDP